MATEFRLPELGEGIIEADVVRVLVREGETIAVDQAVATIETEKATVDVPSGVAGRVTQVHVQSGQTVAPGAVLLTIDEAGGTAASTMAEAPAAAALEAATPETPTPTLAELARVEAGAPAALAPAAPSTAPQPSVQPEPAPPTAAPPESDAPAGAQPELVRPERRPDGGNVEGPTSTEPQSSPPPPEGVAPAFAAPSVRTFAREIGVDVRGVQGSGPGGRIDIDDVKRHARERGTSATAPATHDLPSLPDFEQFGPIERQPLSRFSRTVARNMTTTWSQVPLVTLFSTADSGAFEAIRRRYREAASKAGGTITDGVLLMKIVGTALAQFPNFNSSYDEAAQELIVKRYVHIGLAVDTERGLVVPVVRDVDRKSIVDLAVDFRGISDRVKSNSLTLEEMRGASFTISSLETLGVSHFTPLVNWPEVAILGIGRDADLPSYEREELRVHKRVALSLSFDHRVVDGADGARFLRWLVNAIHEPTMLEVEGQGA